jgi:hypothetical protein
LATKLRLLPTSFLASKLSCLEYQMKELLEGQATDVEDHFLHVGIDKADITYKTIDGYLFVDVTTSSNPQLLSSKLKDLEQQVGDKGKCKVVTIPKVHSFAYEEGEIKTVDIWDKFNEILVTTPRDKIGMLVSKLKKGPFDQVKEYLHQKSAKDITKHQMTGIVSVPLDVHPARWEFPQFYADEFVAHLDQVTYDMSQHDFEVPVSPSKMKTFPDRSIIWNMSDDPVVLSSLISCMCDLEPETIYIIKKFSELHNLLPAEGYTPGLVSIKKFKNKGRKSHMANELENLEGLWLAVIVSEDKVRSPFGLIYPKFVSMACSPSWKGYGSRYLNGLPNPARSSASTLSLSAVKEAQLRHDKFVASLQTPLECTPEVLSHFSLVAHKLGEPQVMNTVLASVDDPSKIAKSVCLNYASQLSSLSHTVTQTSPVNRCPFMFRNAQTTDGFNMAVISMSKGAEKITDLAYAVWSTERTEPEYRYNLRTVSSRKLVWWRKLPYVLLAKLASMSQSNLTLGGDSPYYTLRDWVEYSSFHFDTRQQDSLMHDQTRPTFAAIMSPLPDRNGAIKKMTGLRLKGSSAIIYYSRLVNTHVNMYFRKSGMQPSISLEKGRAPAVVFPSMVKPPATLNDFVDNLFESRVFNKDKDNKLYSEGIDWLGLLDNELLYRKFVSNDDDYTARNGCSKELIQLVKKCVKDKSIDAILIDLDDPVGVWSTSAVAWWDASDFTTGDGFSWNAAAVYTIALVKSHGRRFVDLSDDYISPLALLYDTSLAEVLSGAGATSGFGVTSAPQSCRKPTAIIEFILRMKGISTSTSDSGVSLMVEAASFLDSYQSLLSASLWLMLQKQTLPIVSRTDDKNQAAGWREFSPMNATGIIACRATEIPMSIILKQYPTDLMTDPHAEETLMNVVTDVADTTNIYAAADCSRFGPKQVMQSIRAVLAVLSCASRSDSPKEQLFYYHLTSESTKLTEQKITKMPPNLLAFFKEEGGYEKVMSKNAFSIYGKVAKCSLVDLRLNFVEPYFTQAWGMLQGTISMASSIKSSFMHDVVCDILNEHYTDGSRALVTNDDSLLIVKNATKTGMKLADLSKVVSSLLKYTLAFAGQKLNPFKTVLSTLLAEFHSMFATEDGLLVPPFKAMVASIDIGDGENIVEDMRLPIKVGTSLMRSGLSLYLATVSAYLTTCLVGAQHSRLRHLNLRGAGLTILGELGNVNLVHEVIIPHASDMAMLDATIGSAAPTVIAAQQFSIDISNVEELKSVGLRKVSRTRFRMSRAIKETGWVRHELSLPITDNTALTSVVASMNYGVYAKQSDTSKEHFLIRAAKGASSTAVKNVHIPESTLLFHIHGDKASLEAISNTSHRKLADAALTQAATNHVIKSIVKYYELFSPVVKYLKHIPKFHSLNVTRSIIRKDMVSHKVVTVRNVTPSSRYLGFQEMASRYGSPVLVSQIDRDNRGIYSVGEYDQTREEVDSLLAAGAFLNRVTKNVKGKFLIPKTDTSRSINSTTLVQQLVSNYIPGIRLNTQTMSRVLSQIEESLPSQFETLPSKILNYDLSMMTDSSVKNKAGLFDLLKISDRGWFHLDAKKRIKVAKIVTSRLYNIRYSFIVTIADAGSKVHGKQLPTQYTHQVLSDERVIQTSQVLNFAGFKIRNSSISPGDLLRVGPADIIDFPVLSTIFPLAKVSRDGGTFVIGSKYVLPVSRDPWPNVGETKILSVVDNGTIQDASHALSLGLISYNSRRMKEIELTERDLHTHVLMNIASEFQTRDLMYELAHGNALVYPNLPFDISVFAKASNYIEYIGMSHHPAPEIGNVDFLADEFYDALCYNEEEDEPTESSVSSNDLDAYDDLMQELLEGTIVGANDRLIAEISRTIEFV